jgi:DNA-binding Lrp family transcriptional regulator
VVGFILISTKAEVEEEVISVLNTSPNIEEAHFLFGEWDIIAKVVARDFNEVSKVVLDEIRSLDGVIHTETLAGISF